MYLAKKQVSTNIKNEIFPCIQSDQHRLKLDINNKRNNGKFLNSKKLNNCLLNEKWVESEIKKILMTF